MGTKIQRTNVDPTPFRILTVCTGNVCRSPMAERLLQANLDRLTPGQFEVSSAGTGALAGSPMETQVADVVGRLGGTAAGFLARQLSPAILAQPDLVLTMTREQRSAVVQIAPTLLKRTFTIREFARLLEMAEMEPATAEERWRLLLLRAPRLRSLVPAEGEDDDVVDPYRREPEIYAAMVQQLSPAVNAIISWEAQYSSPSSTRPVR